MSVVVERSLQESSQPACRWFGCVWLANVGPLPNT